jgi:preprotein translocase subunit SecA
MPVHVVTANDYLAARDARTLAPLYAALGLTVAALPAAHEADARRAAYAGDIVYATAREFAFDFLRDRLAFGEEALQQGATSAASPGPPLMRGLCFALLDEADSILLDEADVPLILSREQPRSARRALLWQALALARRLESQSDFRVDAAARLAVLTPAGERRSAEMASTLGGPWRKARYRREVIELALSALHGCRRDAHYVVRDGAIELLDDVTGRVAEGRVWSRGLHTAVALKEGVAPPPETDTVAQITFQRFFQRYWRVSGLSGTLLEARGELRDVLGASIVRIPLHRPTRLRRLSPCHFADADARWQAVCARVVTLCAQGRPVLVGTDSVADSQALSRRLQAAGVAHHVLNALNDAQEAAIVAAAGCAGAVTVATRMAGRGTDIELDAAARAAGGLHVLSCQRNPSKRLDRQLAGRAARHGDPGSAEAWLLHPSLTESPAASVDSLLSWNAHLTSAPSAWIALARLRWTQWCEARRRAALRRMLLRDDRRWEGRLAFAGPSV